MAEPDQKRNPERTSAFVPQNFPKKAMLAEVWSDQPAGS